MSKCIDFFTAISEKEIKAQKKNKNFEKVLESNKDIYFLIHFVSGSDIYSTILENIGIVEYKNDNTIGIIVNVVKKELLIKVVKKLDGFMNMKQVDSFCDRIIMDM